MANLQGRRVRATSAGIFGLGFKDKMKSVAAAGAILALATTGTVVVQSQFAPAAIAQTQDSAAGAEKVIHSPAPFSQSTQVYKGQAWFDRTGSFGAMEVDRCCCKVGRRAETTQFLIS